VQHVDPGSRQLMWRWMRERGGRQVERSSRNSRSVDSGWRERSHLRTSDSSHCGPKMRSAGGGRHGTPHWRQRIEARCVGRRMRRAPGISSRGWGERRRAKGRWESGVDGERMPDKDSVASVEAGYVEAGYGGEGAAGSVSEVSGMNSDSRLSAANSSKAFSAQSGRSPSRIG
jgi:hypothetical protein